MPSESILGFYSLDYLPMRKDVDMLRWYVGPDLHTGR